jgi:hypothetical protein
VAEIKIDDNGFVPVTIGAVVEKPVDLFDVFNRLVTIQQEAEEKCSDERDDLAGRGADRSAERARVRNVATVALLEELGFGKCSHGAAIAFTNAIFEAVGSFEKKAESPESASPKSS